MLNHTLNAAALAAIVALAACGGGGDGGRPDSGPMDGGQPAPSEPQPTQPTPPQPDQPQTTPPTENGNGSSEWYTVPNPTGAWFGSNFQQHYDQYGTGYSSRSGSVFRGCFERQNDLLICNNTDYSVIAEASNGRVKLIHVRADAEHLSLLDGIYNREKIGSLVGFTDFGGWEVTQQSSDEHLSAFADKSWLGLADARLNFRRHFGIESEVDLERMPFDKVLSAKYAGLMSGIAHNYDGRPVWGSSEITAEFDYGYSLNTVSVSLLDVRGNDFNIGRIDLPAIGVPVVGACCDSASEHGATRGASLGSDGKPGFELERPDVFVLGGFVGPSLDAVHGIFSTNEVSGGFGAVQTHSEQQMVTPPETGGTR